MNYTYIVQCADGTLYTGWTNCLEKRMKPTTAAKRSQIHQNQTSGNSCLLRRLRHKEEAMSREYAIKQLTRAKKLA